MSSSWEPVIGLEIHVQLSTRTKMFCSCALSFGEEPNTRTCPVCLGLPGTLPVTNAQAIHFGLMMGLALDCELAPRSLFHRKNYFYPDLAKGYQISQYDIPLCSGGRLGDVRLHRIHLEEDAAKLEDPLAMYLNDVCAVPMSLAGIPAISIPNGLSDGLPTGFQIAGPAFSENRILDAAHALEQAIGFDGSAARA